MEKEAMGKDEAVNETPRVDESKPDPDVVQIRKGELQGYKTQLREMKKQLEEYTSARAQEEQAKLKAAQDWETLNKKQQAELDAMKSELASTRRSVLIGQARSALLEAGMSAGLAVDGALSMLPAEIDSESIPAWLEDVRKSHPEAFERAANPIGAPSVGAVGKATGDPAVALKAKVAATKGKGPAAMMAVMREVDEYTRTHGRNPLA